ncbi:hypothetical protein F506_12610 [Herbaspirillum hiltneri N3]|uniref:DUF1120 domain-containing protein n=1 Tax=Herbaspirillum hiltneri N3 TaxID=1262470 RepID=A0ABM5V1G6_9BURK|nr:DUF1120 domain-containing protein [Herbaspirillum hiltneri]AKZ63399.1 hypothetical protein F506_12610 [Herbaspirillum hiltneri N3]
MNKQVVLLSALLASSLVSFAARAVDTTELQVKGSIRPSACIPSFTNGGEVDFGTIRAADLKAGKYTALPVKQINFNVSCDQSRTIELLVHDNRAASYVRGSYTGIYGGEDDAVQVFGLGSVDGKKVGGYRLVMSDITVDGTPATSGYMARPLYGKGYAPGGVLANNTGYYFVFIVTWPYAAASKFLNVKINVEALLNKPENLNLTGDIPLDGSATFEIRYR